MFLYDKKIDKWSREMTESISDVWGIKIERNKPGQFITVAFLQQYLDDYMVSFGQQIFFHFSKIFKTKYKINDFQYYLNTTGISLHNKNKKFISISLNHPFLAYPTIIIHELFHVIFYDYLNNCTYPSIKKLNEPKRNEIKEIITIIINDIFNNCIDFPDLGYPKHQNIRAKTLYIWKKEKNFETFLLKVVTLYKKEIGNLRIKAAYSRTRKSVARRGTRR